MFAGLQGVTPASEGGVEGVNPQNPELQLTVPGPGAMQTLPHLPQEMGSVWSA
jgi:hypothetical protein